MNSEIGNTIRYPSTANLQVDSTDRIKLDLSGALHKVTLRPPVWDFTIQRKQALMNGFFSRIGTTELVLQWDVPNISSALGNDQISIDISGAPSTTLTMDLSGQYVQTAATLLDNIIQYFNDLSGVSGFYFTFTKPTPQDTAYVLQCLTTAGNVVTPFAFYNQTLAVQLNLYSGATHSLIGNYLTKYKPLNPDLRPFAYIDFVSPSLTYAQMVKDTSTNERSVDVLARWYFSYDQENTYDKYYFPIYQGYNPFIMRRLFNPPKQIKWDRNLPIGNLSFQVYGEAIPKDNARNRPYKIITVPEFTTQYYMTLQLSEN